MNKKTEIYDLLKNNGGRMTKQKKCILTVLLENRNRMMSVNDVASEIPETKNIDNTTVYRNIQQLTELGILESIVDGKGVSRYVICEGAGHHHHMICIACGKVFNIPCRNSYWDEYANKNGFHEIYHKLEVYGKCEKCKDMEETI